MADEPINLVFAGLSRLAAQAGVTAIDKLPGCWEIQIDEQWFVAVNGHETELRDSKGHRVPPYHAFLEYNGWPAGVINPFAGFIAAGESANEETLIAAIEARLGHAITEIPA
jgi:hypothetical protein